MTGNIHSLETMGLVDGPGIRFVVFMQGCSSRCLFCHNPETWNKKEHILLTSEKLVKRILKYRHYYTDGGGVTFSGGEPLLQPELLLETLKLCQMVHLNTCLDTSGMVYVHDELLAYVDLVILDIKATSEEEYLKLAGGSMKPVLQFLEICERLHKRLWLRHVIIPGINDQPADIERLKQFTKGIKGVEKMEFLPYHRFGVQKYQDLNLLYPLAETEAMDLVRCQELFELYLKK